MDSLLNRQGLSARLSAYITGILDSPSTVADLERASGGLSWLTYSFRIETDAAGYGGGRRYVLRLGHPDGHLAPYSAAPEHLALQSLHDSGVPVPRAYWHDDDPAILGAPFLICGFIAGSAPLTWDMRLPSGGSGDVSALADDFVRYLAAIHRLPWRETPLGDLDAGVTKENAAQLQLRRWRDRIDAKMLQPYPVLRDATIWLKNNCPPARALSIVHGDYRLGNFLQENGRISAILDWELAHIGDPHEDLGWTCARIFTKDKSKVCDLLDRAEFFDRYEEHAAFEVDRAAVGFYEILTAYKLVAINLGGIHNFYTRPGINPRIGAVANQLSIHLRLLNKLVRNAS